MTDILAKIDNRLAAIVREIDALVAERDRLMSFKRTYDEYAGEPATEKAHAPAPEGERDAASPSPITVPAREGHAADAPEGGDATLGGTIPDENYSDPIPPTKAAAQTGSASEPATTSHAGGDAVASPAPNSEIGAPRGAEGEAANVAASPAIRTPAPGTLGARILALHNEHPELTANEAAETLGVKRNSVSAYSTQFGIRWATAVQRRDGMGERVAEMHAAHRDWPASRIAEELGVVAPYVRATAKRKGFILPPENARSGPGRREAPTPAPKPEQPPEAIRPPVAAVPSGKGSAIIVKPMAKPPRGTRFYLKNDDGEFLHNSCQAMTRDKAWAWIGQEQHIAAVRRQFPLARELHEVVVPKEQRAAA